MNFFHFATGISLFLPILLGPSFSLEFLGKDFPIFFGLLIQAVVGNLILFYVRGYESKNLNKIYLGYFIFFLGLSGSYLLGKSFWLLFFWELSTIGAIFIYLGGSFTEKAIKSIVALFLASSISMIFLCVWIFFPEEDPNGFYFLLIGLLIKSAFSGLHFWLPEAHSGPPAHGSAAYSGLMVNLPILLYVRYRPEGILNYNLLEILILLAGLGVFMGGINSFFHSDVKKSLAYSTIENSNFIWLLILISTLWRNEANSELAGLSHSFYFLFYITMLHHSISKVFQFLSFGYLSKTAGTTLIDECKGIGRLVPLPFFLKGIGSFSFSMIPGTIGFLSESSFLYLASIIINIPTSQSEMILPSLVFIGTGLALGSAAHLKIFLSFFLSRPAKNLSSIAENPIHKGILFSLYGLGFFIVTIPVLIFLPTVSSPEMVSSLPEYFTRWLLQMSMISVIVLVFSIFVLRFRIFHKIETRRTWDCGSEYRGTGVSIPGSVISDPLFGSLGRYVSRKNGDSIIDTGFLKGIQKILELGRFWNQYMESGDLSTYLFLSSIAILVSVAAFLTYHNYLIE
ncbi:MAG: formate hydrogenase [Leptospiraceae bacterium]|nr:formate hydrogenase [Leptospiraceae bacterium]